ncbi:hypothetical protein, partial [Streptococcus anginosus]|uniref:hypothetical protein n=1 Tax=Streptococcus anginosus TaxID=1328 RepID=UPI002EDAD5F2
SLKKRKVELISLVLVISCPTRDFLPARSTRDIEILAMSDTLFLSHGEAPHAGQARLFNPRARIHT